MVYDHQKIDRLASRLRELDPLSVGPAKNRVVFVYLAASLVVLEELLGQSVGNIVKSTHDDYVVMIGSKEYRIGWSVDPLASQPSEIRLRRFYYYLGFLLRDRDPVVLFFMLLLALVVYLLS